MATYIFRTQAFYEPNEDSIFEEQTWDYSDNAKDAVCDSDLHELTEEGERELDWWNECRRMNLYQRNHCFGFRSESQEQMWDKLTNIKNEYIKY